MIWLFACHPTPEPPVGIVRVAQESQAVWTRNFNPLLAGSAARWPSNAGIYEPLLIYNPMSQAYVPWLATDFSLSEDATKLTLTLRDGVRWSDGESFDSTDVAFTLNLVQEHPQLDTHGLGSVLDSVTVKSPLELIVHFNQPAFIGLERVAHQAIVAEHIWSTIADPVTFDNANPVGTGPFTEVTIFETQLWQLEKNPYYWQELGINGLQFPALPSNDTANLALLQGEIDWAGNFVPAIDRIFVDRNPTHHHYWFPLVGASVLLYPNHQIPPLDDIRVREAISRSIDRELLVRVAMFGYTQAADESGLSKAYDQWQMDQYDSRNQWTEYSPSRAVALLDEAGWTTNESGWRVKDGEELRLKIGVVSGWSDWVRAAQVISQSLNAIGIKAQVDNRDFGSWFHKLTTGDFDLSLGWSNDGPHPVGFYKSMLSAKAVKPIGENTGINWHRYADPNADMWIDRFEQSADPNVRLESAQALQKTFVEHIPAIPLFLNPSWGAYNDSRITGFPSADHPYARLSPNHPPEQLLVLTQLKVR